MPTACFKRIHRIRASAFIDCTGIPIPGRFASPATIERWGHATAIPSPGSGLAVTRTSTRCFHREQEERYGSVSACRMGDEESPPLAKGGLEKSFSQSRLDLYH